MTIFDHMKTNYALCEGVDPRRARVGKARALSFARCRPRGPPSGC